MKKFLVSYRYRGSNYAFMTPYQIKVLANSKKEAKIEAIMQVGDVYKVVKIEEI